MSLVSLTLFLGILIHKTFAGHGGSLSCSFQEPCTVALASNNPIVLKCVGRPKDTPVFWQYIDTLHPHGRAVSFIQSSGPISKDQTLSSQENAKVWDLMARSRVLSGNLKILSPRVGDTGVYTCREEGRPLASYELDFQDAEKIHLSHLSLGHRLQPNSTIRLGETGTAEVFTVWGDWQPCDRCGTLGERKKLGFCYVLVTQNSTVIQEPRPCGLWRSNSSHIELKHPPELLIEVCRGTCTAAAPPDDDDFILVLDEFHSTLHMDILLKCPMSSIYKPVYWEHGKTSYTHLQQMKTKVPYVLDDTTGGGVLYIPLLNKSDEGTYKCYVNHRLAGQFHVTFPNISYTPVPPSYSMLEATVIALLIFMGVLFILAVLQSCTGFTKRVVRYGP